MLAGQRPVDWHQRRLPWVEAVLVFAIFAAAGTFRAPVPGVNEPHFLSKAKHLWDPHWCPHDVFLNSANAHAVYLYLIGAVTRVLALDQTAWLGRVLVWACLALGWQRLSSTLTPRAWVSVWSAAIYVGLSASGSFSGEWVVGGVEAKGFAYAALLFGLANAGERHWMRCAVWTGLATALHPVVGVWGTVAIASGSLLHWMIDERFSFFSDGFRTAVRGLTPPGSPGVMLVGLWLLCALPGLIPAMVLVVSSGPAEMSRRAAEIQVFERLSHHLNPQVFPVANNVYAFTLLLAFAGLRLVLTTPAGRVLRWALLSAILIAELGLILGWGPHPASLMKFYFFRLADGWLPMVVAMALAVGIAEARLNAFKTPMLGWSIAAAVLVGSLFIPVPDRGPRHFTVQEQADWSDLCRWIKTSTPRDAVFLTPRYAYAFKWYAERAEFAAWKDCPQDAPSLIEWDRRLKWTNAWRDTHWPNGYPVESFKELRDVAHVQCMVARLGVVSAVKPIYSNRSFGVYAVP